VRQSERQKLIVRDALIWQKKRAYHQSWRNTSDPYLTWVSEVMLQQTQLARGKDYFLRFIKRFPDIATLARASWRELLPYWRGLGYYARARNLLRAAKEIQRKGRGFPNTRSELLDLPGIGPYTANAILVFSFHHPLPALDTNLKRVLGRVFSAAGKRLEACSGKLFLIRPKAASNLNYALMGIGSELCKPRNPRCALCPLRSHCRYFKVKGDSPEKNSRQLLKPKKIHVHVTVACIHRNGTYLIAKRPKSKGGAWEFPGGKKERGEDIRSCLKREIREELSIEVSVRPPFATFDFTKQGQNYRLHFSRCQILRGVPKSREHAKIVWVPANKLESFDLAETNRAAVKRLLSFARTGR